MDGRGCARPLHRCDGPRAAFYLRGVRRPCERPEQLRGEHRRPYLLHSQPFTRRRVPPLTRNPLGDAQPAMTRCASKAPTRLRHRRDARRSRVRRGAHKLKEIWIRQNTRSAPRGRRSRSRHTITLKDARRTRRPPASESSTRPSRPSHNACPWRFEASNRGAPGPGVGSGLWSRSGSRAVGGGVDAGADGYTRRSATRRFPRAAPPPTRSEFGGQEIRRQNRSDRDDLARHGSPRRPSRRSRPGPERSRRNPQRGHRFPARR